MSEKSFVTLEAAICPVCGKQHSTGALLIDKRMKDRFEKETVTGFAMCEEHQKLLDDGFIALIGADPNLSKKEPNGSVTLRGAHRTGKIAHMRASVWPNFFGDTPVPPKGMCFVDDELIAMLKKEMENLDPAVEEKNED